MHYAVICRILGLLLMIFSITHLPPMLLGVHDGDETWRSFVWSFAITLVTGALIWLPVHRARGELRVRDGYLITALFWFVLGSFGAIPFLLGERPHMGPVDALFEAFSGLSTTGATVLSGLDAMPRSILYYRQQLQWLGGMGIVVLAVAVMPMLGIGGMQLYRAEMPGPLKDNKLSPRIADTAKTLWLIYCGLTVACALAYWAAGMNLFDAVGHSFATISIGGLSTHDASIGYFDSALIEVICIFFMAASGMNFALHFLALRSRSLKAYLRDPECMTYLRLLLSVFAITTLILLLYSHHDDPLDSVRYAAFQVVSVFTTTGFGVDDFSVWPSFLPFLLLYTTFIGACAGSTGGGMKVMRAMLVVRQGQREIQRLLHPNGVFGVKMGRRKVPDRVIESVWGFCAMYMVTFFGLMLLLLGTGLDPVTAFSSLASCMNNLGATLGAASANYAGLPDSAKLLLSLAMILGRLEVFSLVVLLSPAFWRY
ncbi:TrkH family potassium uptake protein [Pseudomonas sp. MAP12]|uniref:Trk system potassium uptake protein n=1 Tax=Geopseudomonas aromaticivorans TaxID=2849492 RepID=A0ABS6MUG0_9GAMM|nr:TrkH family potassium uptake protein [Pseudomonas aromaticivorans]MBV2132440.1 TrkH family potassium uptake protein [Pseudomonas aromaticivorans]